MLTLVDKPLIQYTIEEAKASNLEEIIIITGAGKSAIKNHFKEAYELELLLKEKGKKDMLRLVQEISEFVNYTFAKQAKPLGLGHAVLCAKKLVGDEPFAVFLGDDIIDSKVPAMKQLLGAFKETHSSILAIQRVPKKTAHLYGIIKGEKVGDKLYKVSDLVEKPKKNPPSNLAIIGRYILTPGIFTALERTKPGKGGEIQLTDAIKRLLKTEDVYAYEFEGERFDAGDKTGFIKAKITLALKRPEIKRELKRFLRGLKL